ncbi:MAG TPA: RidA family protein [Candidatus Dormibacteraeota bacterium]|nr:RidA family protein [Candidatus Dormibacteraeota bacterium]
MALKQSPGGFRFLPTDGPFSAGVVAEPGFSIVRAHPRRGTELQEGFRLVEKHLEEAGRPMSALCAMELRIPKPLTRAGFDEFNRGYIAQHERWGLRLDGQMPAARTNVAPEFDPPNVASLHAFCYTVEASGERKNFVVSGAPEPPGTEGGVASYWSAIVRILEDRIASLGVDWNDATETQLYGTRADYDMFAARDLRRFNELVAPGLRWFFSRPPIDDLHLEIDVRGLASEVWI